MYMGRPAPNTPRLDSDGSMTGRLAVTDAAGHTDNYDFSLSPSAGEAAPRVNEARSISSANDRMSSREVFERDTEPGDV